MEQLADAMKAMRKVHSVGGRRVLGSIQALDAPRAAPALAKVAGGSLRKVRPGVGRLTDRVADAMHLRLPIVRT